MADTRQYVTIGVADECLAIPVGRVQEILDVQPVSSLPQAPEALLGMIDVRNKGIPVFDLRRVLGMAPAEDTVNTRILVLYVNGNDAERPIGLRSDRVFEVTALDSDELEPAPSGAGWGAHAITGIGRRDGAFVTVIDVDRLLGKLNGLAEAA